MDRRWENSDGRSMASLWRLFRELQLQCRLSMSRVEGAADLHALCIGAAGFTIAAAERRVVSGDDGILSAAQGRGAVEDGKRVARRVRERLAHCFASHTEKTTRGFSKAALIVVDEAARCDYALLGALRPVMAPSKDGGALVMLSTPV